ncbi:MAG TPA: alginate lyase family protein, partial [Anaerolineales bacterium]|nr:alginate lyase family protein [Anaerolineales bacterium]
AALRLMAWTFGFYAFLDSPSSTPTRIAQFTVMFAAHAERIYRNIDYAISTRSNHTMSEAFGLWLVGLLFPELKDAGKYFSFGRKLLEQEALEQIFPDGSYSMYSLNYHRFILHIYLYAIRLGELNGVPFSETLKARVTKSVDYLYQLIDPATGQMPVYGSNDGALVLPLNNCDFTDYRPLLQLGSYLTKKELLFEPGPWDEDVFWFYGETFPSPVGREVRGEGETSFPHAGMYILYGANSKAVIRCTDFRARPSHADQLHVDLWWHGVNIACDAGTYLYSGEGVWRNGLARTSVHNTVIVDRQDQMKMVSRFTWTNWAKGRVLRRDEKIWQGEHNGYRRLIDPVDHKRTVLALDEDRWLVVDHLDGRQPHHYSLHWLFCDGEYEVQDCSNGHVPVKFGIKLNIPDSKLPDSKLFIQMGLLEGTGNFTIVRADENSTRGWRSRYYGQKEPALSAMLETDQPRACFWTYFGLETDVVETEGDKMKVNSKLIDLDK